MQLAEVFVPLFLTLPASYAIAPAEYSNIQCGSEAEKTLEYANCTRAFQSSIPSNSYTTTQGELHAEYGGCYVTVGSSVNAKNKEDVAHHDILKRVLSLHGQAALDSCAGGEGQNFLAPGSALIVNAAANAQFNMSWSDA